MNKLHSSKWYHKFLLGLLSFCLLITVVFFVYVNHYYPAEDIASEALYSTQTVDVKADTHHFIFIPKNTSPTTGLIFYPGAKVEARSYAPLMQQLANEGYLCVLVEMPFNLALFKVNAADQIIANHPEITNWYLSGHSLGGAMAASYTYKHSDLVEGLILLAAYSTSDLSQTNLKTLTIYGSNDQVLNYTSLNKYQDNLPITHNTFVVEGGNHANFAYYGPQKGDGIATLTPAQQISITTKAISQFTRAKS